jgi:ABC-2 type transport system permease protein
VKALVYVVVAAGLVVVVVLRRRQRARGAGGSPLVKLVRRVIERRRGTSRRQRRAGVLGDTGLVAAREIRERMRGRFFKVITIVLLAVVAAAVVIPTLHSSSVTRKTIAIVGPLAPSLRQAVVHTAKEDQVRARLVTEPTIGAARAALRSGTVELVIDNGASLLVKTSGAASGATSGAQAVHSIATLLGIQKAFRAAKLSPTQASTLGHARALPVHSLATAPGRTAARSTAVIGLILVFIMLTQYNTWTLMGVMEEKASRVVEVLLATVRPIQLLAGKVLGIGLLALLQAGLVVGLALILADAVGSSLLKGTAPLVVVATLVWLVLGYAFYCWVYAAAGSMAERQDQVQSLALPLSIPIIFGYIVGLTAVSATAPSLFVSVLAYLPPTAPFAMPVLVADGHATWWQFAISVALSIAATVGVAQLAAAVYRRAVLRTGRRVRLSELRSATR